MSIRRVARVEARIVPHRWEWAERNAEAVAANFARRKAVAPAIFDGPVLMVSFLRDGTDRLEADFFTTGYARLIAHLDGGCRDPSVRNGFAMGALRSADGAFLLGEMAPHTAHAGQLYFPAGTPDPTDVRPGGTVDLEGSIRREVGEETGIELGAEDLAPGWIVVEADGRLAFIKEIGLADAAETIRLRARAHFAAEDRSELSDLVAVRGPEDIRPDRMPLFLQEFLRDAFAAQG